MSTETASAASPEMSRVLYATRHGGVEVMQVKSEPKLQPGKGHILLNVKAAGINFAELMARQGLYDRAPKIPMILGYEAAGVVDKIGEDVTTCKVGDKVFAASDFGLWREHAVVKEENVFHMPENMSFEEAAAIPVNYLTAYLMLFDMGNLRKGKKVLVHMAAGGVGIAASQLCKTVDDVTVFGTSSAHKHDIIRQEGVTHPIDYRTQDYVEEIRKISPEGLDIVLDPLGGADSTKGFNLLKPMGKIVHFGMANMVPGTTRSLTQIAKVWWATKNFNALSLMSKNKSVCGFHLGHMTDNTEVIRGAMTTLIDLYKEKKIKPRIDSVWAFEDAAKAMLQMHERKNIGKVILSTEAIPLAKQTEPAEEL